jgi:hypothetical protein
MATDEGEMKGTDLEDEWRDSPKTFIDASLTDLYCVDSMDKRGFIRSTAVAICNLQNLESGDVLTVRSTNYDSELELEFQDASEFEDGNYVYEFTPTNYDAEVIHIVIDFEGAYTSIIDYYVPYVTVINPDGISLGDVTSMEAE